tara:strand:- start:1173 stop:1325 length:153 start_codon:yes stop_codon:yes gene_type:complete
MMGTKMTRMVVVLTAVKHDVVMVFFERIDRKRKQVMRLAMMGTRSTRMRV